MVYYKKKLQLYAFIGAETTKAGTPVAGSTTPEAGTTMVSTGTYLINLLFVAVCSGYTGCVNF